MPGLGCMCPPPAPPPRSNTAPMSGSHSAPLLKAPLVAAVLHQNPLTHLDKLITYTSDDIRSISPVAQQHVQTGMTIGQLCDAAIRYSDGTAANLLLADLGGPGAAPRHLPATSAAWVTP